MDCKDKFELKAYNPPLEWEDFAHDYGVVKLFFINNGKNSFHYDNMIYLNIKCDKWKRYCLIVAINSYEEAVVCKFLHEIAHILYKHKNLSFKSVLKETEYDYEVATERLISKIIFEDPYEKEAWSYVFEFRARFFPEYMKLVEVFKRWLRENRDIE